MVLKATLHDPAGNLIWNENATTLEVRDNVSYKFDEYIESPALTKETFTNLAAKLAGILVAKMDPNYQPISYYTADDEDD